MTGMKEHDEGDLVAASLFVAASDMFDFTLNALKLALEQERMAGFTEDGRQLEPPVAHVVRPLLEAFLAQHQAVPHDLTPAQGEIANRYYREHLHKLCVQLFDVLRPYET